MWVTNRAGHWWMIFWVKECRLAEGAIEPRQHLEQGWRLVGWAKVAFGATSHWWIVFWVKESRLAEGAIESRQRLERG